MTCCCSSSELPRMSLFFLITTKTTLVVFRGSSWSHPLILKSLQVYFQQFLEWEVWCLRFSRGLRHETSVLFSSPETETFSHWVFISLVPSFAHLDILPCLFFRANTDSDWTGSFISTKEQASALGSKMENIIANNWLLCLWVLARPICNPTG